MQGKDEEEEEDENADPQVTLIDPNIEAYINDQDLTGYDIETI